MRLRADAKGSIVTGGPIGIGDAEALTGPLLDPVDRYSELIATTTVRADRRQERHARKRRQAREERERFEHLPGGVTMATLESIASCESGGDPEAVSADGTYRGKYQFSRETWRELGGTGDPASAPEAVQDQMAAKLMATQGPSAWPNCA